MANQADRGGVQQLIEKWRERGLYACPDKPQPYEGWSQQDSYSRLAGSILLSCADQLKVALAGSVASPQEPIQEYHSGCTGCGSHDGDHERGCSYVRSLEEHFYATTKMAGSGATTPAPQWEPIETAPKHGHVLLGRAGGFVGEGWPYYEDEPNPHGWWHTHTGPVHPTHWMSLPKAPSEVGAAERTQEGENA